MSYIRKLRESKKILDAAQEALNLHEQLSAHIQTLQETSGDLLRNANTLIALHQEMMANLDVKESEIEREIEVPLQVHTTHGIFPVGSKCPTHGIVHSDKGSWYICLENGFVDVTGWYPNKKV